MKQDNQHSDEPSVLATVPMWFGLPDASRADQMITQLSDADHETDWGMRIISSRAKNYDGSGYHYGAVWPLFTGWASVAEYRYHRALSAYFNLRANALLGLDGSLGHFSEVLSGDYYQSFSTSSPHQIWSSAMVLSPILRGLFGLQTDVQAHQITLTPHVPADWPSFGIRNVHLGAMSTDFQYHRTLDSIVLETRRTGTGDGWVEFSPSFSLRTTVVSAALNGKAIPFKVQQNANDQHVLVRFPIHDGSNTLVIRVRNDFGLALANDLPPLGSASRGLRVVSESWNSARNQLTLDVSGASGGKYELAVWNPAQISAVEGALLNKQDSLQIQFPGDASETYVHQQVVIHFGKP